MSQSVSDFLNGCPRAARKAHDALLLWLLLLSSLTLLVVKGYL